MSRDWIQRQVDRAMMVVLAGSVLFAGVFAFRSLRRRDAAPPAPPVLLAGWRQLADSGNVMGPAAAPLTILELSDFQCPFCSQAAATIGLLRQRHPGQVRVVFRHFPLTSLHPFAYGAAVASECAADQGRFEPFHDALFGNQDSLGKWSLSSVAARAGVADIATFDRCQRDSTSTARARVTRDIAVGHALGVTGTPVVIVQGLRLPGAPSYEFLDSLARIVFAGDTLTAAQPTKVAGR